MCVYVCMQGKRQREGKGQKSGRQEISHTWGFTEKAAWSSQEWRRLLCNTSVWEFQISNISNPKTQAAGVFFLIKYHKLMIAWYKLRELIILLVSLSPVFVSVYPSSIHSAVHLHIKLIPSPHLSFRAGSFCSAVIHFRLSISQEVNPSPSLWQDKDGSIAPLPSCRRGMLRRVPLIHEHSIFSHYNIPG